MRKIVWLMAMLAGGSAFAAEHTFDFSQMPTNQPPRGCQSLIGGSGSPGIWKVITDEVPLPLAPVTPNGPSTAPKAVVAQLARDITDEHFPMLVLGTNTYGDFTFRMRFKIMDGVSEQMAGIAFRLQDEKNYYYVRASAMSGTVYFFRVLDGVRTPPIGNNVPIEKGAWHELGVSCKGPEIRILLDGKEAWPAMSDPTFSSGKIALWTKSDSICYFTDAAVTYTPRESFAQLMVRDTMKQYSRLLGVKVFMVPPKGTEARVIASNDEKEIGEIGPKEEMEVIEKGINYVSKGKDIVHVTMPLRDRNGDTVAAVRLTMTSFKGQTEENAVVRAMPIVRQMQLRTSAVDSLAD